MTVIPRDQSDGRLHGKDELEQVSMSEFLCLSKEAFPNLTD